LLIGNPGELSLGSLPDDLVAALTGLSPSTPKRRDGSPRLATME
jgi:hypothetical protein